LGLVAQVLRQGLRFIPHTLSRSCGPITRRHALETAYLFARRMVALGCAYWLGEPFEAPIFRFLVRRPPGEEPDYPLTRRLTVDSYRLPQHVLPSRYDLRLNPDLQAFTFSGHETVTVTVRQATSDVVLNAAEIDILEASIEQDGGRSYRGSAELDEATERCRITFPATLAPGTWRLRLSFRGTLNDKLRGFYRSTYKDTGGQTHVLAATQFEATDARRAFPCWDEPAFKAVFAVTLEIDPALTAVSNSAVVSERIEHGQKILQFAETIRMSTYLVAFVVGNLEATPPVSVGATPIRVWSVPGKSALASFGQEAAVASLRFFEHYYGLPYPGGKLDLLAVPDFASGAMENLGAITFRETALLVDRWTATHAEIERIADVVAHENAHMWFGDLVTMSWWNGLWLNEAFATFMEMLAVDSWKPDWRRWTTFGVSRAAALSVDGLHSSRPIEYPVRAPRDADAMFDVLTYEKGASVLRMLEQHLGPDVFRDGVRDYLRTHAYGNADTGDLWAALGRAAKQPVPALLDGWIFRPGYPLLAVSLEQGSRLRIAQQRFTYLEDPGGPPLPSPPPPRGEGGVGVNDRWQVPVQFRITAGGKTETKRLLLTEAETKLALPTDFESVLLNEGGHGFYRVRYAPDLLERLFKSLPSHVAAIERFNLVNDAWAAAIAGLLALADYLELTARFRAERDKNVWAVLLESFQVLNRIVGPADRPALETFVRDRVGPAVAELGWTARPNEDDLTRQLRGDLVRAIGTVGNDTKVQAQAAELYAAHTRDVAAGRTSSVDPNLMASLIAILAHVGDAARYEEFHARFRSAATPQEERRYLYALATFQPVSLLERTLTMTLNGEIRTQDAPFLISVSLMSVYGRERAWRFVKANWEEMDRKFPKQGLRRMCGGIVGLATKELDRDVRAFFQERKIDLGGKTLEQYLEQLRILVTLRERDGAALRQYLERFTKK